MIPKVTRTENHFISFFQNTHLDRQQLSYCVSLIENGANPEALAVRCIRSLPFSLFPLFTRMDLHQCILTNMDWRVSPPFRKSSASYEQSQIPKMAVR